MTRRRDDDSGEYDRPRKSGGLPVWAWVLVGVSGFALVLCGGCGVYLYSIAARVAGDMRASEPAKKTYTREEFRSLVKGKKAEEVKSLLGTPESTQQSGDDVYWYYTEITVDTVTGKTDWKAQLVFERGVVVRVNY